MSLEDRIPLTGMTIAPIPGSQVPGWTAIDPGFNLSDLEYTVVVDAYGLPGDIVGVIEKLFVGRMGEFQGGRSLMQVPVNSQLELLNVTSPQTLYGSGCVHQLYSGPDDHGNGCRATVIANAGTVTGVPTIRTIPTTVTGDQDYYTYGVIRFEGGPNAGLERTIQAYDGETVTIYEPLPELPVAGDAVTLFAGCDKTRDTCMAKFDNGSNFLGMPFIPVVETTV